MADVALVTIDVQVDFVSKWTSEAKDALVRSVDELVAFGRTKDWAILWVRQEFEPDLSDAMLEIREKKISVVIRGTPGADFLPGLPVLKGDPIVTKKRYSAFFGTKLESLLLEVRPRYLVFCGLNTHACVRTSVIDAYQRDYHCIVAREAVGSWDREHHEVSLRYLDDKIARVLSNREILEQFGAPG